MNEGEWITCLDLERLISYLRGASSNRLDRKARLFACVCVRRVWERMHAVGQAAVVVAERFADGLATSRDLASCYDVGMNAWSKANLAWETMLLNSLAVSLKEGFSAALYAAKHTPETLIPPGTPNRKAAKANERQFLRALFMDIFGNPFRPVAIPLTLLAWHDDLVVRLAQTAYDERQLPEGTLDNGRLAILADALEEAGCTDADILCHLRGPGPHVRGCWVIDLLLGKS